MNIVRAHSIGVCALFLDYFQNNLKNYCKKLAQNFGTPYICINKGKQINHT